MLVASTHTGSCHAYALIPISAVQRTNIEECDRSGCGGAVGEVIPNLVQKSLPFLLERSGIRACLLCVLPGGRETRGIRWGHAHVDCRRIHCQRVHQSAWVRAFREFAPCERPPIPHDPRTDELPVLGAKILVQRGHDQLDTLGVQNTAQRIQLVVGVFSGGSGHCVAGRECGWWRWRDVVAADEVAEKSGGLGAGFPACIRDVPARFITILVYKLGVPQFCFVDNVCVRESECVSVHETIPFCSKK